MQENYLANWIQSLFLSLGDDCKGTTMGLGGDGRYFNKEAVQIILKLAAGTAYPLASSCSSSCSSNLLVLLYLCASMTVITHDD